MTPSPFGQHQYVAVNFASELRSAIRANNASGFVLSEIDWRISDVMIVRPDVVVVERIPDRHIESTPLLVAEVLSNATAEKDRTVKFDLYLQQRVPKYLILDPQQKTIEVFELYDNAEYRPVRVGEQIGLSLNGIQISIPVIAIFS